MQLFDLVDDYVIADYVISNYYPNWAAQQKCLWKWRSAWIQMDQNYSGVVSWDEYEAW